MPNQNTDSRQIELRTALPMVGSSINDTLDTIFPKIDAEMSKLFEDRNVQLSGGGTIGWTGTVLSFTANLLLGVNQKAAGGAPTSVNLGTVSKTLSADSRMYYAVIDRNTFTATLVDDATSLPAATSSNKEVFLIAKRIGTSVLFRNGVLIETGRSITFTKGNDFYGSLGGTTNALVKTNGTDGKTIQGSGVTLDNSNTMTTPGVFRVVNTGGPLGGTFVSAISNNTANNAQAVFYIENNSRGNSTGIIAASYGSTTTPIPGYFTYSGRGTSAAPTATQTNDYLMVLSSSGYGNTGVPSSGNGAASIEMLARTNFTSTSHPSAIIFRTTPVGSTGVSVSPIVTFNSDGIEFVPPIHATKYIFFDPTTDASTTGSNATIAVAGEGIRRLTNSSLVSVSNIGIPDDGTMFTLCNATGNTITLIENSGGTANLRILTGTGSDMMIPNNGSVDMWYDSTTARWRVRGVSGAAVTLNGVQTLINKTILGDSNIIRNVQVFNSNHTADVTINSSKELVLCDASAAPFTVTFPAAASNTFVHFTVKKTDSSVNHINLAGSGMTSNRLSTQGEVAEFVSNGSSWVQIKRNTDTDWIPYTVTWLNQSGGTLPTKATSPVADQGYWRRVGDSIEIRYDYYQTSATGANNGTGGEFHFAIPNHTTWVVDTSKITNVGTTSQRTSVGSGLLQVNGIGFHLATTQLAGTNKVALLGGADGGGSTTIGSGGNGIQGSTGFRISFMCTLPITSFESNMF